MELFQPEEQRRLYISCTVHNLWRIVTDVFDSHMIEVGEWLGEWCKAVCIKGYTVWFSRIPE